MSAADGPEHLKQQCWSGTHEEGERDFVTPVQPAWLTGQLRVPSESHIVGPLLRPLQLAPMRLSVDWY